MGEYRARCQVHNNLLGGSCIAFCETAFNRNAEPPELTFANTLEFRKGMDHLHLPHVVDTVF